MGDTIERTAHDMMGVFTILVCISMVSSMVRCTRYTRDTSECIQAKTEFDSCTHQKYENYRQAHFKGDDKMKPDWTARRACTFLTQSVTECGNLLVGVCNGRKVKKLKNQQLVLVLKQVKKNVPNWNSEKCPATKTQNDQFNTAKIPEKQNYETNEYEDEEYDIEYDVAEDPRNGKPEAESSGSISSGTVSVPLILLLTGLILHLDSIAHK